MKNLHMSLKKQWFDLTKSGIKTEDYREITPYWVKRLIEPIDEGVTVDDVIYYLSGGKLDHYRNTGFVLKNFETNTMTLGYPKSTDTERILILEHAGIEIRTGNTDWGAEPNKLYFVIKHGRKL